jgi:hypothetical protein
MSDFQLFNTVVGNVVLEDSDTSTKGLSFSVC